MDYVHARGQVRAASFIPVVGLFAGGYDLKPQNLTIRFNQAGTVKAVEQGSMISGGGSLTD